MTWRAIVPGPNLGLCQRALLLGAAAAVSLAATPSPAQVSPPGFERFKHSRWGTDEGAPNGIFAMAQDADGFLWLAGDALYRFDGISFERIDWPAGTADKYGDPTGLMVSRSGLLWVGFGDRSGVAVYRSGRLVDMHMPDPPAAIALLTEGFDGTIWAASGRFDKQLRRLRNGRWESVGAALGLPDGAIMGLVAAPDGGLWVALTHQDGATGALAYLAPDARRFRVLPQRVSGRPRIALDPGGALWISDMIGTRMAVDSHGKAAPVGALIPAPPNLRTPTLTFDRHNGLWSTTSSVGISYVPGATRLAAGSAPPAYAFGAVNGLTSDFTYQALLDREGSIWIATETGLDQFRRAAAVQEAGIPADPAQGLAMAAANDGSLYVQSRKTVFLIAPGDVPRPILKLREDDLSMCAARDGGIWIVQRARTLRVRHDRAEASSGLPAGGTTIGCAEDRLGRLWVALLGQPLIWRDGRGWHTATGMLARQQARAVTVTPTGGIAVFGSADLTRIEGNRVMIRTGLPSATMLARGGRDVFLSDSRGLVRLRDGHFKRLDSARFPWLAWLRSLVQTPRGDTWLVARTGISRVATADLDRVFEDPQSSLHRTLFNSQDGLVSAAQHAGFTGTQSAVAGDGRIWFLNRQGAAYFDPARLAPNPLAPPVSIRALASGGTMWRDPRQLDLPPGTRAIDITYAGLSLVVPQRVKFRYRLAGVDEGWVDAGTRRTASYANLGPGRFRFQVIAANDEGVWNRTGATLDFEIRPTFLQSWPFKALCAAAAIGLLWLAYSARMRFVAARIRLRMAERFEERERIARELHDTLLQAIQALTWRFQLVLDDLPPKQPGRATLLRAIDSAEHVIAEGRDRVRDLRAPSDNELERGIDALIARQGFDPAVAVTITTAGTPRAMDPLVVEDVTRIAGEALFNIWRHARASVVGIEIRHGATFALRIADNGIGIDPEHAAGGRAGHFGLAGMRERAAKLRGDLVVRPLPDRGTELVLTLPAAIAYKEKRRGVLARLRSL
ncbi:sensor histidine kinase [Sphingosinicella sp. BN140058]|uniref:sensor histidine kinase n=1 Tax=Sphingosinicella sp. BN140058 TaxID=1892855 RepID=UPI0013ED52CB|nr:sensor histidine kinase [Sphingosinicella sp. BN140058]